ncbi:MAG TPA: hypothetical protein VHD89_08135 [Rhodanobacteraceae bacterium]|nr:hypothetical protein [Rhodanobacteraceae bacterium]
MDANDAHDVPGRNARQCNMTQRMIDARVAHDDIERLSSALLCETLAEAGAFAQARVVAECAV